MTARAGRPDSFSSPPEDARTADDVIVALAKRRLSLISETLGLDADHFERARAAADASCPGEAESTRSEHLARIAKALSHIADPLVKDRLEDLLIALADDDTDRCGATDRPLNGLM